MDAPKCKICGKRHYGVCTQCAPETEKRVHNVRQVGIRQLRANLSKELTDLPFEITKGGVVIARVVE